MKARIDSQQRDSTDTINRYSSQIRLSHLPASHLGHFSRLFSTPDYDSCIIRARPLQKSHSASLRCSCRRCKSGASPECGRVCQEQCGTNTTFLLYPSARP